MGTGLLLVVAVMLLVSALGNVGFILLLGTFNKVTVVNILALVVDLHIFYYAVKGYKKPHGNLLRYCMFLLGSTFVLNAVLISAGLIGGCCLALAGAIVCYISGRLDKFDKNRNLFIIAIILLFAFCIADAFVIHGPLNSIKGAIAAIAIFSTVLQILPLYIIYACRYNEHKEAGLVDAPNK